MKCASQKNATASSTLLIVLFIIGMVATIILPFVANKPLIFLEVMAVDVKYLNGVGEYKLFWGLLVLSIILFFSIEWIRKHCDDKRDINKKIKSIDLRFLYIFMSFVIVHIFFGYMDRFIIYLSLLYLIINYKDQKKAERVIVFSILFYYGAISIVSLFNGIFPLLNIKVQLIRYITFSVSFFIVLVELYLNKKIILNRMSLLVQCFIPFMLIALLNNTYNYHNELITIPYPIFYVYYIVLIIIGLTLFACWKCIKMYSNAGDLDTDALVLPTTIIAAMITLSTSMPALIFPGDWHHAGEEVFIWYQWKDFGKILYSDILPSSGLYPMVNGFVQDILMGGLATTVQGIHAHNSYGLGGAAEVVIKIILALMQIEWVDVDYVSLNSTFQ